jgi:SpoVK/Ycf46/Vps4 family AAA+-type ATPase
VDIPKGVLLFGMPGCGKSLAAKYTAKLMGMPLLRLDMGRIMGPYLGQSEENLRKAIKIAESIAPSILWIDEIEKALAGVKGGNNDTVVRIFGTLLTWMQEKTKPVFVIATANDISGIPPEFLRKGRFDETFFVDFPDKESIKEIFKIHLKKRGKEKFISTIDFDRIVSEMKEGYAGADIEAIVSEVVERAFLNKKEEITTEDILSVIKSGVIKPISETLKDKIEELRKTYENISAKPAN